jgi:hypothetical protein
MKTKYISTSAVPAGLAFVVSLKNMTEVCFLYHPMWLIEHRMQLARENNV